MVDCEICGQSSATVKVKIDSTILSTCVECAKAGKIIEDYKAPAQKVPMVSRPLSEEFVVPEFATIISQARQKTGLKQEELATKMNERLSTISAVESGKREPDLKLAKKLERFLGIKLVEFT